VKNNNRFYKAMKKVCRENKSDCDKCKYQKTVECFKETCMANDKNGFAPNQMFYGNKEDK
jgi:hypothetical protein